MTAFTNDQIKHMVDRFLQWRLPENFNPDGGISFKRIENTHAPDFPYPPPTGTNLLDATQAEEMVRYMIDCLPVEPQPSSRSEVEAKIRGNLIDYWDNIANDTKDLLYETETGFFNAIESVRGFVDSELRAQGGWIACSERLPGPNQRVLAYSHDQQILHIADYRPKSKMYRWDFDTWGAEAEDVTHWMPLPAPPEEKG